MKRLKLFFACLLMAVLSIGQVWGVTITGAAYQGKGGSSGSGGNATATVEGVTITSTKAYYASATEIREYQNGTLTVSSSSTITSIVITCTGDSRANFSTTTGTLSAKGTSPQTWTGSATSVTFTADAQSRWSSIEVTLSGGTSQPTVSLDPDGGNFTESVEVTITPSTGATAYYTTDATKKTSPSTTTWTPYNGSAKPTFTSTTTIWVAAVKDATWSDVVEKTFTKIIPITSYDIDFETTDFDLYVNWDFTNAEVAANGANTNISAHGGTHYGTTGGKATAAIKTHSKIASPGTLSCYVSKQSDNTSSSTWYIQVSENGTDWTDVESQSATSMTKGNWVEFSADLSAYTNVYVRLYYSGSTAVRNVDDISLVMASGIAKPTITGEDNFLTSTEVTMSCTTDGAAIYYTTTESAKATPATSGDWKAYDNSNKPSFSATTTVWAAAKKNDAWSAVAEKTFTKATILTVAEALAIINGWPSNQTSTEDYYVQGTISQIDEVNVNSFATYYISADGTTTDQLQVYKGLWVNGANFTSADQIQLGDDVLIKGKLRKYSSYKELDQNNEVISYKLKARLAWSVASYNADIDNPSANVFPTLTNTNSVAVTYSSDNTDAATIDPATGDITLVAVGSTTITASFAGNGSYKANSVSYTLNVASSVVHATISFDVDGGEEVAPLTDKQAVVLAELPVTTKAGKNFGGWFKDVDKTIPAVAEALAGDITLHAKWLDPYTVAEAKAVIDANPSGIENQYVAGIISQIDSYNNTYHSITYWISADGTTTNQLQVYSGLIGNAATPLGKEAFSAKEDLELGDEVVVTGTLKLHNSTTYEFDKNNTIYSFNRPVVGVSSVSLPATETVEVGSTVTLTATVLPENASDKSITWTVESGDTYASVENGVVTGLVAGEAVIRATSVADGTKYAECTVTVTAVDPTKHVVTFDATIDKTTENTELSITKGDLTIAITSGDGRFNNTTDYRPYKNAVFTVSCSNGKISKIEFTCTSGNTVNGFADAAGLDKENSVWTGNAESVSFTASNAQVRIEQLVITYKEDTRDAAGLAWDPADDIEITVGDAFSAPALVKPNDITVANITIASNNPDLATVTEGVVSLVENATGEATITATFTGDEKYKPATVSYNITVNAAAPAHSITADPDEWTFATVDEGGDVEDKVITITLNNVDAVSVELDGAGKDAFSFINEISTNGTITVSASSDNYGTFEATLTISDDANQAAPVEIALSITVNEVIVPDVCDGSDDFSTATPTDPTKQANQYTERTTTNGWIATNAAFTTIATEQRYLTINGKTTAVGVITSPVLSDGIASLKFRYANTNSEANGVSVRIDIKKGEDVVKTYTLTKENSEVTQGDVYTELIENINVAGDFQIIFTNLSPSNNNSSNKDRVSIGKLCWTNYTAPEPPTPATPDYTRDVTVGNYGTICLPNGGTIEGAKLFDLEYFDQNNTLYLLEVNGNAMVAGRPYIFLPSEATIEVFYTDNAGADAGSFNGLVGSYTQEVVDQGDGNYILYNNAYYFVNSTAYVGANRAYIHMEDVPTAPTGNAPGRRRVAMTVNGEQVATGMGDVQGDQVQSTKVLINGQLFILRGEKMYDVTGKMVK